MKKNVLVTGCNGQLGNEIQALSVHYPQFHYFFTDVQELDICNESAVETYIQEQQIDVVVNCAAYTAVDKAETDVALCEQLNHKAAGFLASAIARRGGEMIHISTDYVFDGSAHIPYCETMPTCPNTVYGRTKLAGEQTVLSECPNSVVLRTSWLYSAYGNNFVKTMLRLGREKEQLGVIFDQIGTPTYARDLARVIFTVLMDGVVPGIYHFSNEGVISWYDFTKAIHRIAGITTCKVLPLHTAEYPAPAPRPHYSVLDKTKLKETYRLEIPYWEDSLQECITVLEAKNR